MSGERTPPDHRRTADTDALAREMLRKWRLHPTHRAPRMSDQWAPCAVCMAVAMAVVVVCYVRIPWVVRKRTCKLVRN